MSAFESTAFENTAFAVPLGGSNIIVSDWGTAGADITAIGFDKLSGDTGAFVASTSGRAYPSTNNAVQYTWPTDLPPSADYWVELKFRLMNTSKTQRVGVIGRASNSARTFYLYRANYVAFATTLNIQLYSAVADTFTQLGGNYTISGVTAGLEFTLRLDMTGTTIKGYVDTVERHSVTDSAVTGAGRVGIYSSADVFGTDTQGFHIDDLAASFVGGGGGVFTNIIGGCPGMRLAGPGGLAG